MPEVAQATITVTPVMAGAQEKITNDLTQAAGSAGTSAGKAAGTNMSQSMGKSMTSAGTALTKGVTGPLTAIGTAAVASWKSVDEGLDTITEKTGASGSALDEMQGILSNIATSIPTDFATAGAAIGDVSSLFGVTGKELEELSGQFLKFSQVNGTNVSSSIKSVQGAMAAFGMDASDASDALDILNKAGQDTGVPMDQLASALLSNGTALQDMGFGFNTAVGFLANLKKSGVDSSAVMTGMKKALQNATKEGKPLGEALGEIQEKMVGAGSDTEAAQAAMELFGNKAGPAIAAAVRDGRLSFDELSNSVTGWGDSVSTTFEDTKDPMDDFMTTMNEMKLLGSDIVESAGPMIVDILGRLADGASKAAEAWNGLSPEMQDTIIKVAGIAAVAGPLLAIGGKVIGGLSTITSGIGGLVGSIGGLGGAAETAAGPVASAGGSFGTMAGEALKMIAAAAALYIAAQAISVLVDAAIRITDAGGPAIGVLAGMAVGIGALMYVASACGPAMTAGAVGIGVFGLSLLAIGGGVALACAGITMVVDAIGGLVEVVTSNAESINSIVSNVGTTVGGVITTVSDGITQVIDAISGGISGVLDSVAGIFESMGTAALDAGTGFEKLAGAILNLTKNTSVFDLAGTMASVATGVGKVNKAAQDASSGANSINSLSKGILTIGTSSIVASKGMMTFSAASGKSIAQLGSSFRKLTFSKDMEKEMSRTISVTKAGIGHLKSLFSSTRFNFHQHIDVPHFSMSGSFNAKTGSTPTVSTKWYQVAESSPYLFRGATLFGGGEHNDEILYGREAFLRDIREASGGGINISLNYDASDDATDMLRDLARGIRRYRMAGAI